MIKNPQKILITGSCGFIGFHLSKKLIELGYIVIGVDNINDYYDPYLKKNRLSNLDEYVLSCGLDSNYSFHNIDISNKKSISALFDSEGFDIVINLAAQAGVRYSLENPNAYVDSNLVGFVNLLEAVRNSNTSHFIFASSSSVYGMNKKHPFSTSDNTDYPVSLYAATKKSNEVLAHSYSHLFNIPTTGLRFFTVYGPYGRPDMAYFSFTKAILEGRPIDVYNNGNMKRDFTYVDDIVEGISRLLKNKPMSNESQITSSNSPYRLFNIGNNNPVTLKRFIKAIEKATEKKAIKNYLPMQPGDVPITYANIDDLFDEIGFQPSTTIENGIKKFVAWYLRDMQ